MTKVITIVIAEDQSLLQDALATLLNLEQDISIVGRAADGEQALDLVNQMKPDLLLTDIEMPNLSGLDVASQLHQQQSETQVIILTTFGRAGYLRRAMEAGVKGFLLKDSSTDELAKAIRKVVQGRKVIAPELITDAWEAENPLTEKERKALALGRDGLTTEQIAEKMHLSPGTVRNYLSNASNKLNATNRIDAARLAHQKGWL